MRLRPRLSKLARPQVNAAVPYPPQVGLGLTGFAPGIRTARPTGVIWVRGPRCERLIEHALGPMPIKRDDRSVA